MKIVCVSHEASITGAPKVIFQLAARLSSNHEIVLVTKEDGPLAEEFLSQRKNIRFYNTNTSYKVCRLSFDEKVEKAIALLEEIQPDLVYANSVETAEWVIAARLLGIKNIFHLHEMADGLLSALRTSCLVLDVMNYVDLLICVSKDVEADVYRVLPIQPNRVVVVENFFEVDKIVEQSTVAQRSPLNALGMPIDLDQPIICSCGIASYRKGVDIFFELAHHFPEIQFLWIGRWDLGHENPVGDRFKNESLKNFFITGQVSNPYYFLKLSQMVLLTSRVDPNPLFVFESLILSKQVICCSKTGGSRFVLDQSGYVVEGEPSVALFVDVIQRMLLPDRTIYQPDWINQVSQNIRERYDISSVFSKYEELIQQVVADSDRSELQAIEVVETPEKRQSVSLFQQFVSLVRGNEWWLYKLAPVLGTAYATAMILDQSLISLGTTFLFLLIALVIGASYASIINNLCDREEDEISGKANNLIGRSHLFIVLVLLGCIIPGLIVSGQLIAAPLVLSLYMGNWLVFTLYSLPPIRLKKRGLWGVLAIAVGESLVPQMLGALFVAQHAGRSLSGIWLTLIAVWAFASGLRSIFWHQIMDFENDRLAGVNTFAVNTSVQALHQLGKWIIFPLELIGFLGILLLSHNVLVWSFFGLYLATEWLRHYFWQVSIIIVKPIHNHRVLLFEYYDLFYPLGFLCSAAWHNPISIVLLSVHLLFYYQRLWWWLKDVWGLLRWEASAKVRKQFNWVNK